MKSTICFSKNTKNLLSVYATESEAQQSADYQLQNGHSVYPYHSADVMTL
ncbi:hypothetical protein IKQ19_20095 [Candidatus Saccharibacteria bacterium]|nr:hypothetical protein [Candidatus Saccharibacteria bacterium]